MQHYDVFLGVGGNHRLLSTRFQHSYALFLLTAARQVIHRCLQQFNLIFNHLKSKMNQNLDNLLQPF